ncbi:hypothetical protein [Kineococcus rubinsiae]|uniref:hypothetical protein n=1 Tax=Kineococcus rubinsiae TaxID=2609562 RepID=UPI00142FF88C|nr:hypothetical protein [Kineococcus rubinsiae]NIZ90990.1 hypothetical protein [Kineococcus rubinsiae]
MSIDLRKDDDDGSEPSRVAGPGTEVSRAAAPGAVAHGAVAHGARRAPRSGEEDEKTQIERYGIDERRLTPLGLELPGVGFVPDAAFQAVRWVGLGTWIVLYSVLPGPLWFVGFIAMWIWIGGNAAYASATKGQRRQRKREMRALRLEAQGGPPSGLPVRARPATARRALSVAPAAAPAPARAPEAVTGGPRISAAEKSLLRTVRRVDTSDRFERTDVVLVHEVADLLAPLLEHAAERDTDALVRHDLETLALEHLPRTVDDFLRLPADVARTHVNAGGATPAQELRNQLHLLLEGCEGLRDAVHDADVTRQQEQSRFLEAKFRRSDLDL